MPYILSSRAAFVRFALTVLYSLAVLPYWTCKSYSSRVVAVSSCRLAFLPDVADDDEDGAAAAFLYNLVFRNSFKSCAWFASRPNPCLMVASAAS